MSSDPINPKHYKRDGIECINAIKAALVDGFPDYLRGNVLKYLWRYKERNGAEDLRKARQYLEWLIEESEAIAEASGASDEPSNDTQIPQGWRELKHDEVPSVGDKFLVDGGWVTLLSNWTVTYGAAPSRQVYIRKIEPPPKRYRDPTLEDLKNGPIECEVRNHNTELWMAGKLLRIHMGFGFSSQFECRVGRMQKYWHQCRIEVAE